MIDLGWFGQIAFTWEFFAAVLSIVLIDLVLAGDNAVVIAMAVKNLKGRTRQWGIVLGAGGAVLRVISTFLVAQFLTISFGTRLVPDLLLSGPLRALRLLKAVAPLSGIPSQFPADVPWLTPSAWLISAGVLPTLRKA